jgi:hypothetical protein
LLAASNEKEIQLYHIEYVKEKLPIVIHTAPEKTTPADADEFVFWDSVTGLVNKITWANIKASLQTVFDGLYAALTHTHPVTGQYRQFVYEIDGSGDVLFPTEDGDAVFELEDVE